MSLTSPTFFLFVAFTIVAFHAQDSIAYRRFVLTAANAIFIASYVDNATELMPLASFLLLGYAGLQFVRVRSSGTALALGIAVILTIYIFLRRFSFFTPVAQLPFPYLIVGLSYILFRVLQLIVDAANDDLPDRVGPLAFFRFTCNFLCFVSGPIQRYQDFAVTDGVQGVPLDETTVYQAFSRVVTGYGKFLVIGASANYILANLSPTLVMDAPMGLFKLCLLYAACSAAYTAYLYYNFSGYMDIVIGIGILLGQKLPENFNQPFLARSFLEFWQRWHMTLSNWFRFYLFNPFLTTLMIYLPAPVLTAYLGVLAFFVTFLVMGIWHGTTLVCLVYGLLMGAGASINKLWQVACAKRLGRKRYRAVSQTTAYVYLARGLTIAYFAQTLTYLWVPNFTQFVLLGERLGMLGEFLTYTGLTLAFAVMSFALDTSRTWIKPVHHRLRIGSESFVSRNLFLGSEILAIAAVASLFNKAPEFIYKAF